jgi:DNA-binding protein HU-beta
MHKTDLVRRVSRETRVSQRVVGDVLNASTKVIAQTLREGRTVSLIGFGTFYSRKRKPSKLKHIRSGKELHVPAMRVAGFRAGELLRKAVRKGK